MKELYKAFREKKKDNVVQKIDINNPVSSGKIASVILQPVNLEKIAMLIDGDIREIRNYINDIIN